MDVSPLALTKLFLSELPIIIRTFFLALFHLSPTSPVQDITTQLVVATVRPILGTPAGLKKAQRQTAKDLPIRGPGWVSKVVIPRPRDEDRDVRVISGSGRGGSSRGPGEGVVYLRQAVEKAFRILGDGREELMMPELVNVEAEWNAYRSGVGWLAKRPKVNEEVMYGMMMKDVEGQQMGEEGPTILYFHGGAFCLMDPSTHRLFTTILACKSRGRCFSIRFRMAPVHPFPTSLIDCLVAYLALLSPPPSSYHSAVNPSKIVFAGDSSGGALAVSLTLLLSTLLRNNITHIRCWGWDIPISLPAGLALLHPYIDISRALPSVYRNADYDIITPPEPEYPAPLFPADEIWPSTPYRVETYSNATSVIHPLVSPVAATAEILQGFPPTYLCAGYEGLEDEISVFARRLHLAGSYVQFDGYVGMPHCFSFLMPWARLSRRLFATWSKFSRDAVTTAMRPGARPHGATWTDRRGRTTEIPLEDLALQDDVKEGMIALDDGTVERLLTEQRDLRIELEREGVGKWWSLMEQKGKGKRGVRRVGTFEPKKVK